MKVDVPGQVMYGDGQSFYMIYKDLKEIQVFGSDGGMGLANLSPKAFIDELLDSEFEAGVTGESAPGEKPWVEISLKPTDRSSDVAVARIKLDPSSGYLKEVFYSQKDGSRFGMTVNSYDTTTPVSKDELTFDKAKFEGFHVEDMRE